MLFSLKLQKAAREEWRKVWNIKTHQDFKSKTPIVNYKTVEKVETREQPWPGTMTLYFGKGWQSSEWNESVIGQIASQYFSNKLNTVPETEAHFRLELKGQMLQSQKEWRNIQPRISESRETALQRDHNAGIKKQRNAAV